MGQQVSVETFTSSSDHDGNKYWASFDPYPFKVGSRKLVYMGILNGNGPLKGQKCVVKTMRRKNIGRKDWMLDTKRAKVARDMANAYNTITAHREPKISVSCPIMAEVDTLSDCMCINDVIGKPKKNFKETDYVSMELYIRGSFDDFEYGWVSPEDLIVPEAFSHFTWCRSEGSNLVSNLQGVRNSRGYQFTGPVIHSDDRTYGSCDLGHEGIKGFFALHKCNRICRNWPRLGDGVDLRGWGEFICSGETFPSAPPIPSPPPYEEEIHMPFQTGRQSRDNEGMQMASWQQNGGRGMLLDWREEIMNQNVCYETNPRMGMNSQVQNQMFGMQLMWYVKQMNYAFYPPPPPPYFSCPTRRNDSMHHHDGAISGSGELDYYSGDSDKQFLLPPPPYSEESVSPEMDCMTYL